MPFPSVLHVSGTTLSAGKYITDDIYLSLDQGLTPGSSKVTVEVELTPNLTCLLYTSPSPRD